VRARSNFLQQRLDLFQREFSRLRLVPQLLRLRDLPVVVVGGDLLSVLLRLRAVADCGIRAADRVRAVRRALLPVRADLAAGLALTVRREVAAVADVVPAVQ